MNSKYPTIIHERNALSRAGNNSTVICRMPSGWAVLGDHQFMEGYSLLLADPEVDHLSDLDRGSRTQFLLDMSLLGEAVLANTPAYRINYEILGNTDPVLHAHIWPRFADEPEEYRRGPVARYPKEIRQTAPFSPELHGDLQAVLRTALQGPFAP